MPLTMFVMSILVLNGDDAGNELGRAPTGKISARPNIVLIMADDVGFSDLGCYGSEIHTPNLDRLAAAGMRFTQFYNNAVCVTSRASLLSGRYPRWVAGRWSPLAPNAVTFAEVLKDAGYGTVLSGKWHLGDRTPHRPIDRGFDEYYGLLDGCCNFFNPVQRDPPFEGGRVRVWGHNDRLVTEFPHDFYATDAITDHAISNIRRLHRNRQPFVAHVCYTAAHSPLHAKPADIERYRGHYTRGWNILRQARYEKQLELGLIDPRWKLPPREPEFPPWDDEPNKAWQQSLMEVYAAMIDNMDQNIGRILSTLEEEGIAQETVVIFLSDNGGCASQAGGDDVTNIPGSREHYVSCGAGWAYLQNTPFRRYKAWAHEGGIATPFIIRWPGVVEAGTLTQEVGHVIDLLPTLLDIAGIAYPTHRRGENVLPLEGQSLSPILRGSRRERPEAWYWMWENNRAIRQGNWKLVMDAYVGRWELYDLAIDRTETNDLSTQFPDRVAAMSRRWESWSRLTGANTIPPDERIRLGPDILAYPRANEAAK